MMKYVVIAVVVAIAVGIFSLSYSKKAEAAESSPIATMSDAEFWGIIERSRAFDQDRQAAALDTELAKLTPAQIEAFGAVFDRLLAETYSWDLWGAAYIIMGGASDDSFEYFRVWMISQGRGFFETAKADPDALAALIPLHFDDVPEFESFAYVAGDVWARKTGGESAAMPHRPEMMYSNEPIGEPFDESAEYLANRYPKLWTRFSEAPLG